MTNRAAPRKKVRATVVFLFAFSAALSVVSTLSAASTAHAADSLSSTLTMPPNNLGLVAHWTFDGPTISGTSVTDVSGQGNTGTLEYSPPPVAGVFGQALSLNGGNQYVNCGTNNPTFNFASTSSFTESVWAYPTRVNGSWQAVFQVGRNLGLGNYQGIWLSGGNQWVFGSTGGGNLGTVYATPNKWVNITVVHTATSKAIYINGVLNTTGAGDYINGDQGGALCGIGSWGAEYFAGSVDDMRVYNRALSAYEIKQLYNAGTATHQNATINPPNLQQGLVAHWTFDGPTISGTTVKDVSGNNNNGTMVNGPTVMSWVGGQALAFNGVSQYVNVGSPADLNLSATTGKFTLSAWVYPTANPTGPGVITEMYYPNNTTVEYEIGYGLATCGTSALMVGFYQPSPGWTTAVGAAPVLNKWQLITGTFDGTTLRLYLNGQQVATDVPGVAMPSSAYYQNVTIGRRHDTACSVNYFPGKIDDPHIYNRALSPAEVQQLYNLGTASHQNATVNPPNLQGGLVGHWTFDGPTISGTTVKDVSGSGNNGTMVNGPAPVAGFLGQALSFNGTSQYVSVSPIPSASSPLTVSAWVYPKSLSQISASGNAYGGTIIDENENGSGGGCPGNGTGGWMFGIRNTGVFWFWPSGCNDRFSTGTVALNKWTYVVATYDGTDIRFYINGVLDSTQAMPPPQSTATFFKIGHQGWVTGYWDGSIDDVRIYNRALSASEIQQLYNLGR